jgi:hypothetical protein
MIVLHFFAIFHSCNKLLQESCLLILKSISQYFTLVCILNILFSDAKNKFTTENNAEDMIVAGDSRWESWFGDDIEDLTQWL